MYEKTTSSTTYKIPQCCCKCLGPADKVLWIIYAKEWTHEGIKYRQSYQFDAPICSACRSGVHKRRFLGIGLFLASAAMAWLVWQQDWNQWEIWVSIGIVIAGLITLGYFWFAGLPADTSESGIPIFRNAKYQQLFNDLNGVRPFRPENYDHLEGGCVRDAEATAPVEPGSRYASTAFDPVFEFGSATSILRFPAGAEANYTSHVRLLEHLAAVGILPDVRICGLKAGSNASCARLILITGAVGALRGLSGAYFCDEAEAFVKREHRGDWSVVSAASTLSNVPDAGLTVGDLGPFNELCQEIASGTYHLDTRIS